MFCFVPALLAVVCIAVMPSASLNGYFTENWCRRASG
jgi:hypothetical protein